MTTGVRDRAWGVRSSCALEVVRRRRWRCGAGGVQRIWADSRGSVFGEDDPGVLQRRLQGDQEHPLYLICTKEDHGD
ncbi:hypothetical protein Taro_014707 [Colocasia esculenta]|uniref:Uncharacterized protein n=1 Tax=Colocasia esculenta TaxID=4460 RepID=A0A843UJW2_COLES|nr:hypothetical protein [Colocasia esculenta]